MSTEKKVTALFQRESYLAGTASFQLSLCLMLVTRMKPTMFENSHSSKKCVCVCGCMSEFLVEILEHTKHIYTDQAEF